MDSKYNFRMASEEELNLITNFWRDELKRRKTLFGIELWGLMVFSILMLIFFIMVINNFGDNLFVVGFSFLILLIIIICFLGVGIKNYRREKGQLDSVFQNRVKVLEASARNIRFEANYDYVYYYGYADIYDSKGNLIQSNVFFPEDFSFNAEMKEDRELDKVLLFSVEGNKNLYAIPIINEQGGNDNVIL